jgi:hypothetical protein
MTDQTVFLTGTTEIEPPTQVLAAGPLTAVFDRSGLRWITWHGIEILRGLLFLVRTESWGTPEPEVTDLHIIQDAGQFAVSFTATYRHGGDAVAVSIVIEGHADGRLAATADIHPLTAFVTNRTGFVVLHPIEAFAGKTIEVEHASSRQETIAISRTISPGQPVFDIRAITHRPRPDLSVSVRFEGDVFEMEDQRNWTDGSFKTYSRPLGWPAPYALDPATSVRQSVILTIAPESNDAANETTLVTPVVTVALAPTADDTILPKIAIFVDGERATEALSVASKLGAAAPTLLILRLQPVAHGGLRSIEASARLADATKLPVALELLLDHPSDPRSEIATVASALQAAGLRPVSVAAFPKVDEGSFQPAAPRPPAPSEADIRAALQAAFPGLPAGGGTPAYFPELNRKRPPAGTFDFLVHGTTAIVHAADDRSVFETIDTLPYIIETARSFAATAGYRLGPIGIGARINPYGAGPTPNPDNQRTGLAELDPRQRGLFAAAWHVAYAAKVAPAGLDTLVIGAPSGPFGIVHTPQSHAQPWFDQHQGSVFPLFHAVTDLAEASGHLHVAANVSDPSRLRALAWQDGPSRHLLLVNPTANPVLVRLSGLRKDFRWRGLDHHSFIEATGDPVWFRSIYRSATPEEALNLPPYALVRVRLEEFA